MTVFSKHFNRDGHEIGTFSPNHWPKQRWPSQLHFVPLNKTEAKISLIPTTDIQWGAAPSPFLSDDETNITFIWCVLWSVNMGAGELSCRPSLNSVDGPRLVLRSYTSRGFLPKCRRTRSVEKFAQRTWIQQQKLQQRSSLIRSLSVWAGVFCFETRCSQTITFCLFCSPTSSPASCLSFAARRCSIFGFWTSVRFKQSWFPGWS